MFVGLRNDQVTTRWIAMGLRIRIADQVVVNWQALWQDGVLYVPYAYECEQGNVLDELSATRRHRGHRVRAEVEVRAENNLREHSAVMFDRFFFHAESLRQI